MKNLSDFTGEEAIELWADMYDQFAEILTDDKIIAVTTGGKVNIKEAAKLAIKEHKNALMDILTKLEADVNGANLFPSVIVLITEMVFGGKAGSFFGSSAQETSEEESSGNATESIEGGET